MRNPNATTYTMIIKGLMGFDALKGFVSGGFVAVIN